MRQSFKKQGMTKVGEQSEQNQKEMLWEEKLLVWCGWVSLRLNKPKRFWLDYQAPQNLQEQFLSIEDMLRSVLKSEDAGDLCGIGEAWGDWAERGPLGSFLTHHAGKQAQEDHGNVNEVCTCPAPKGDGREGVKMSSWLQASRTTHGNCAQSVAARKEHCWALRKVSGESRRMSERKGGQAGEHRQQLKVTSNRQLVVRGERKHT